MEHPENDHAYKGLTVNSGVKSQPIVNPYRQNRPRRKKLLSVGEYVDGILKGDISILSKAVTLVESTVDEHQAIAQEVIEKCLPYSGKSRRIGITGVPGAGKSTSIDEFGLHIIKEGHRLAVLAIDPSSERSRGSILGDKIMMQDLKMGTSKHAFMEVYNYSDTVVKPVFVSLHKGVEVVGKAREISPNNFETYGFYVKSSQADSVGHNKFTINLYADGDTLKAPFPIDIFVNITE